MIVVNFSHPLAPAQLSATEMGYFPSIIRLRPVSGSVPPQFEVAEILNLHSVREKARLER